MVSLDLNELSRQKLMKMMEDHRDTGGLSFFDEDNGNYEQKRAQNISKYKQSLM